MARHLPHLCGLRLVLIGWVVVFHQTLILNDDAAYGGAEAESAPDRLARTLFRTDNGAVARVHIAVVGFVVLSGFVVQWSQGERSPGLGRGLVRWYAERLDRVLLTTWFGMGVHQVIAALAHAPQSDNAGLLVRCYLQLEPWFQSSLAGGEDLSRCPDLPVWTIGCLLPQWLLYPLVTQRLITAVAGVGLSALLLMAFAAWGGYLLVFVIPYFAGGRSLDGDVVEWRLYTHPLAWVPVFAFGAATGALVDGHSRAVRENAAGLIPGVVADVCAAALLTIAM
eukprot:4596840-Prymnesium_polylepis.1